MQYGIGDILTLLGSLGLFLYGMKVMSDALMEVAGDKMRTILASMTSNRFFAVITGFLITAVIQSSSATTLMVVSFVNASLLTLTEAIGVILGAHIGTTVTAWLITLLGFKVNMSAIALPLVALGFLLTFSKKPNTSKWGSFIIGFSVLFIGLQFLKDSVPNLKENPEMLVWVQQYADLGFWSVLIFLAIGTILTLIVQSSSATMALTLVMCHEGWIPLDMAAAMVLGENIGTTITANLAALVANFNAKRAARAHFISQTIGVIIMLFLLYPFLRLIDSFTQTNGVSAFDSPFAIPVALSAFHTSFNIFNTLILIWFIPLIAKLVKRMVPEKIDIELEIDTPKYLNDSALKYPQTGIAALVNESSRLYDNSIYKAIAHGVNVHRTDIESNKKLKEIVLQNEVIEIDIDKLYYGKIKNIYNEIVEYATKLQSNFELDKKKIKLIRNILIADRHLVSTVKDMKALHKNMSKYLASDNIHIKKEYNDLRKILIRVIRFIQDLKSSEKPEKYVKKIEKLKSKAHATDVLIDGSINKLVRKNLITNEMATSLMNDSANASQMVRNLINFAELQFLRQDLIHEEKILLQNNTDESFLDNNGENE